MQAFASQSEDHDWDKVSDDIPADEVISATPANADDDADDTPATPEVGGSSAKETGDKEDISGNGAPSDEVVTPNTEGNTEDVKKDADAKAKAPVDARDEDADPQTNDTEDAKYADDSPAALQIVSIGTETDEYAFTFHDDALRSIMDMVPSGHKVCVVSVVGAFRTGKSFLLSWFLRYLNHKEGLAANAGDDEENGKEWYDNVESLGNDGFNWRGGAERNTTGIWMWSKPFILQRKNNDDGTMEDVAVLLVDTQGMFDHETTMGLTAAIFGLSTLLSSYQIYNVDKRIQEDNLQQLALFSEYGRMALQTDTDGDEEIKSKDDEDNDVEGNVKDVDQMITGGKHKPFQRIEFLVRDWQNFDDDEDIDACEAEMKEYLDTVLAERAAADLKDTREQITSCFDEVSCFLMTHPGFAVTKKKYKGETSVVEPNFKAFLDRYCTRVFENLVVKSIHGRELTAAELGAYIKTYAKMFESGAHFPEAATMLEATAYANNTNATSLSIRNYKDKMDYMAGAKCSDYMDPGELDQFHKSVFDECIKTFDSIATFGSFKAIEDARKEVLRSIEDSFEMYTKLNESRNPLLGFETYILPLCIGCASATLRWITDFTCSSWSQTCRVGSDVLSHVYQVVFFFIIIIAATKAKQINEALVRLKKALEVMTDGRNSTNEKKGKVE